MPRFQVELTISTTGSFVIEADDIEAATEKAEQIEVLSADYLFKQAVPEIQEPMHFVDIDAIVGEEQPDEGVQQSGGVEANQ